MPPNAEQENSSLNIAQKIVDQSKAIDARPSLPVQELFFIPQNPKVPLTKTVQLHDRKRIVFTTQDSLTGKIKNSLLNTLTFDAEKLFIGMVGGNFHHLDKKGIKVPGTSNNVLFQYAHMNRGEIEATTHFGLDKDTFILLLNEVAATVKVTPDLLKDVVKTFNDMYPRPSGFTKQMLEWLGAADQIDPLKRMALLEQQLKDYKNSIEIKKAAIRQLEIEVQTLKQQKEGLSGMVVTNREEACQVLGISESGLPPEDFLEVVKKAKNEMLKALHPVKYPGNHPFTPQLTEMTRVIIEASDLLTPKKQEKQK